MLKPGDRVGPYEVLNPLGHGGMGHVFLARDPRLGRTVVIKTLRDELTHDPDAVSRFRNEAKAASALNHPGIVHIYEIDEATVEGHSVLFIAMEHVRGKTLRQRFENRSSSSGEVIEWGAQVAEALCKAHENGIIHRDLKPENVMVTDDGFVKVLDFGLAKLMERQPFDNDTPTAPLLTTEGIVVGTAPYMSPEQLRGEPASTASDIFALGIILFEGLAGEHPFQRTTTLETMHAIGYEPPSPKRSALPRFTNSIVMRCLEKNPEVRYRSARQLANDLREAQRSRDLTFAPSPRVPVSTRTLGALVVLLVAALTAIALVAINRQRDIVAQQRLPQREINTIAVLPFGNSADPEIEYLGDGLTESIIYDLSRSRTLRVVPRSSVFSFKGKGIDPREAGRRLQVDGVVTGDVSVRGDQLIVRAELIDVANGSLVWGDRYERATSDIVPLREELERKLRQALNRDGAKAPAVTESSEAFRFYLRGRYFWNKRTADGLQMAAEQFQKALEADPAFALAWVGLGDSYALLEQYAGIPSRENCPKAKAAVQRGQELDPSLAQAWATLGLLYGHCEWNWTKSEAAFKQALRLDPNYATAYHWYALHLAYRGEFARGLANAERAQELDPLSLIANNASSVVNGYAGKWDEVLAQSDRLIEMDPNFPVAHMWKGRALRARKQHAEAIASLQRALELSKGRSLEVIGELGSTYALAGRREEALTSAGRLEAESKTNPSAAYPIAAIYSSLGEKETALQWLDRAFENQSWFLVQVEVEPLFEPLRGEARFAEMLSRVHPKAGSL